MKNYNATVTKDKFKITFNDCYKVDNRVQMLFDIPIIDDVRLRCFINNNTDYLTITSYKVKHYILNFKSTRTTIQSIKTNKFIDNLLCDVNIVLNTNTFQIWAVLNDYKPIDIAKHIDYKQNKTMNTPMTKTDALSKIKELEEFINQIDKPINPIQKILNDNPFHRNRELPTIVGSTIRINMFPANHEDSILCFKWIETVCNKNDNLRITFYNYDYKNVSLDYIPIFINCRGII